MPVVVVNIVVVVVGRVVVVSKLRWYDRVSRSCFLSMHEETLISFLFLTKRQA